MGRDLECRGQDENGHERGLVREHNLLEVEGLGYESLGFRVRRVEVGVGKLRFGVRGSGLGVRKLLHELRKLPQKVKLNHAWWQRS